MADNLGPNGLVVSAGKWAASMAAENCTSCKKSIQSQMVSIWTCFIFRTKCDFLSPLRRQFSGLWDGLLKPYVSNPFSPYHKHIRKKTSEGVGTAPPMLWCIVYNCECEHSHLYPMLHSAHQGCATPFKEKKSSYLRSKKKADAEYGRPDPVVLFIMNLRIEWF